MWRFIRNLYENSTMHNTKEEAGECMHILMISLDFLPTVGGITAHVYELSLALLKNGCDISIITRKTAEAKEAYECVEGINVYRMDLRFVGATYGFQINRFIKQKLPLIKPDIIHIHGMRPLEFYAIKDIPLVYTNHTSGYLKRIQKGGYRIAMLQRLFQKPSLFLAPSHELLETPFELPMKKVYIPNGVISRKLKRNELVRAQMRQELGLKQSDILAIITRRLVQKNGVRYLALATQSIKSPHLKILIIGDGEEFNEIKQILENFFANRFWMLGSKKHHEIIDYYSAADISILPSLMEATSISGLEAMGASLPLVGTRVGGIPELIKDGINGYLCEPKNPHDLAEKIDKLLSENFKAMGEKSYEIVCEYFDWDVIAKATINEYKELL